MSRSNNVYCTVHSHKERNENRHILYFLEARVIFNSHELMTNKIYVYIDIFHENESTKYFLSSISKTFSTIKHGLIIF